MSPTMREEVIERFQDLVNSPVRIGVSEFARSKVWRDQLPQMGCFEVVDRNGVIGYMMDTDYALALNDKINELERQVEQAQIDAMFKARADRVDVKSGEDLKQEALAYFDENADALMGIIDDDQ